MRPGTQRRALGLLFWMLAWVLASGSPAIAQSPVELIAEADAIWDKGDHRRIESLLRRAFAIQSGALDPGDIRLAETLGRLCRNAFNAQRYAEAEAHCRHGLDIAEMSQPRGFETARQLGDLAAALRMQRRFAEAEPLIRRSLEIRRQLPGPTSAWVAAGLDNLSRVLVGLERLEEAQRTADEAAAIRADVLGETHPLTGETAGLAAWIGRRLGLLDSALTLAFVGGVLMVMGVLVQVNVEMTRPKPRLASLAGLPKLAACLCISLAVTFAATVWLSGRIAAGLMTGQLAELLFYVGLAAAWLLGNGAANLLRRYVGLPRQPFIRMTRFPTDWDSLPADVQRALGRGYGRIDVGPVAIFIGSFLLPLPLALGLPADLEPEGWIEVTVFLGGFAVWFALAWGGAWVWWSLAVPRWRVWSLEHVEDIATLERAAIEIGLLRSTETRYGRWSTRQAWWTAAQRTRARQLLRGRAGPAWSGDT